MLDSVHMEIGIALYDRQITWQTASRSNTTKPQSVKELSRAIYHTQSTKQSKLPKKEQNETHIVEVGTNDSKEAQTDEEIG